MHMSYWRFAAMIATSTIVMFGLMYIHTYTWDHAYMSETRGWMALLMGAVMAIIMLGFMLGMYRNRIANLAIFIGSALVVVIAAWLIRSQATVSGLEYMRAMVPHHSIALLTSERARIRDARVRKLADEIIEAQRKEIAEMAYLIDALQRGDAPVTTVSPAASPELLSPGDAARRAELAETDLESLTDAELRQALGDVAVCRFAYAPDAAIVAAATARRTGLGRGVIKLHGRLARMEVSYPAAAGGGFTLAGDDVKVDVFAPDAAATDESRRAHARLTVGTDLEAGYAGYFSCTR
ncbi:hypothetical protein TBR22_A42020 [Luteitalea sp. TBR-22]|uniref:DUF305 domain-containing protein n=1 Tax=Luteitalea sp. TBR-22 TaxID=2802971 RepID=UPI001AF1C4B2|nr:DUF305 domain-containing protein [Luteitalea sp. TBR-22]BCS34976.1 hypothetical protein TBR22_A42020 [Luteitalea sp. TBR-22]